MTVRERDRRRRQRLARTERARAKAEAAYKKTRSYVWLCRLRDLTTKACALAPARLCNSAKLMSPDRGPA